MAVSVKWRWDGILYLGSRVKTYFLHNWKWSLIQCNKTCNGFGNPLRSLSVQLKLCHRLLDHSLSGICNRLLLLSQLWVVLRKVVLEISCVAKVFKLSSTHLTNCVGLVNSPLDIMELKMLLYSSFQRSRCRSYRLGASHCSHFVAAQT